MLSQYKLRIVEEGEAVCSEESVLKEKNRHWIKADVALKILGSKKQKKTKQPPFSVGSVSLSVLSSFFKLTLALTGFLLLVRGY